MRMQTNCGLLHEVLVVRMQTDLWFVVSGVNVEDAD